MTAPAPRPAPYLVAVRYAVEPELTGGNRDDRLLKVRRDLLAIAKLGFNSVILTEVEDADRTVLLEHAREAGLFAAVPDRRCQEFVRTGTLPTGCAAVIDLARLAQRDLAGHPAFRGLAVGPARGPAAWERAQAVCAAMRQQNVDCLIPGGQRAPGTADAAIVINTDVASRPADTSLLEEWLAQLHKGLMAGNTAGVIIDRYRGLPGGPPALVPQGGVLAPPAAAALAALLTRARQWGPRLQGMTAETVPGVRSEDGEVLVALLRRGSRRYLLVANPAADRYVRNRVLFPDVVGGLGLRRAVEVPPSADAGAGRVIDAQPGGLTLPVALRSKEAALFEIF